MLLNYFKTGFRNLWKNKRFSAINLLGLSIGMASAILILLWTQHELSFDRFHQDQNQLYKAMNKSKFDGKVQVWGATPKILGPTLKAEYPDFQYIARANDIDGSVLRVGDTKISSNGMFTDPDFLKMFSFPLLKGNIDKALSETHSIVITESLSKRLFGKEDPIGKTISLRPVAATPTDFTVTGLLKDLPNNTQFAFDYLLTWSYFRSLGWDDEYWGNNSIGTYVKLQPGITESAINKKIENVTITHSKNVEDTKVFLFPVAKGRLYSQFENGISVGGRIALVRLFFIIAGLILLIACINFMNISTARSEKRAREVGIRKVVGAQRASLIGQFLGESILLTLISGVFALLIVQLSLPSFNLLTEKVLSVPYSSGMFWLIAIGFLLFTGLLAGSYPAFYLSSFRPIRVLKGTMHKVQALITPRKVLVVTQFTVAIVLIAATIIIRQQIRYAQERDAGYNRKNLGYVFISKDIVQNYDVISQQLYSSGAVVSLSKTSSPLTENWSNTWDIQWEGKDPSRKIVIDRYCTDGNLVTTAGFTLSKGRDINLREFPGDSLSALINESAVKVMGFSNPIGQTFEDNDKRWTIVGVVKDIILESPYDPMKPMVLEGPAGWFNALHLRLNPANSTADNLRKTEAVFKKYNPDFPFKFSFIDEQYEKKFNDEQRIATLASLFAGLTIFISCLGLFALATYMAENRVKEIGVRKVLGASVLDITSLLSKDFLVLVAVSILLATPVAWWAMHKWLLDFNYRVTIQWWVFAMAGVLSILIALATVSYNSIRAAMANPTKSLRNE
ncbi:FtsX-like permease family protein [Pseudoflavitalea sp. G-6-1-2]|uniref:ABC transporter permease n=1 Tax=Pseudoflavitalea sp. G-6-1-2 TaxID=2728841 RepID=UPI00146C468C|nr:ABC transporter permease [Pseudoflavitalea sp. G-6-1-2]NML23671.1 FtsX-like permease family protein [Pseudoflavitalea sp. G-6-1-2]